MKQSFMVVIDIGLLCAVVAGLYYLHVRQSRGGENLVHVENEFSFGIAAPVEKAAPLFGAQAERVWAGDSWDPSFVHPQPAADVAGSVFTIAHEHSRAIWVNTAFDLNAKGSHIQYVYVIPEVQAVLIDIHLDPLGGMTRARVQYQRTALNAKFNAHIIKQGAQDRASGPEWGAQIATAISKTSSKQDKQ